MIHSQLKKNFNRLLKKIRTLLLKGVTPEKLALTISVGIFIGVSPLLGTTTLIAALAALGLRLNQAFMQAVHYSVYPLQLILFVPFMKMGNNLFNFTPNEVNFPQLLQMFQTHTLSALVEFSNILFGAILLWFLVAVPFSVLIYQLTLRYIKRKQIKT